MIRTPASAYPWCASMHRRRLMAYIPSCSGQAFTCSRASSFTGHSRRRAVLRCELLWRATANSLMRVCAVWSRRRWRSPGRRYPALPEARARGVAQKDLETDVTDLGPGQPDPSLLPVPMYRSAMDRALRRHKADALGYGANAGRLPAREVLARWSAEIEQADCDARNVFVTAGATHALDLLCSRLRRPRAGVLRLRPASPLAPALLTSRQPRRARPRSAHDLPAGAGSLPCEGPRAGAGRRGPGGPGPRRAHACRPLASCWRQDHRPCASPAHLSYTH